MGQALLNKREGLSFKKGEAAKVNESIEPSIVGEPDEK
jgi:hypothetical protein